jgi:acetate kinase
MQARCGLMGWSRSLRRYRNAAHLGAEAATARAFTTALVRGYHKSLRVIAGGFDGIVLTGGAASVSLPTRQQCRNHKPWLPC